MKPRNPKSSRRVVFASAIAFLLASVPFAAAAASPPIPPAKASIPGDLSRDRAQSDPSARGWRSDDRLADRIQSALTEDESLSEDAKDVKVITTNGNVILKGKVGSLQDRAKIESIVREVARNGLIENDLEVRAP